MEVGKLLFLLEVDQIRQLAESIYLQEANIIEAVVVNSEPELAQHLADSRSNYDSILTLLDNGLKLKNKYTVDGSGDNQIPTKLSIATNIYTYIVYSINYALQAVNNYSLRLKYLEGITANAVQLTSDLHELDCPPEKVDNDKVKIVAELAAAFVDYSLKYAKTHHSDLSQLFSQDVRERNMSYEALMELYTEKLGFEGKFEDLEEVQRLQVLDEIMEASGRGRVVEKWFLKASNVAGIAALIFSAALVVWDIYSSDNKLLTLARDVVVGAASYGGALLGDLVGTALASAVLVEAGVSTVFVVMAGFATGFIGGFIVGAFVGWLFDKIIGSGGKDIPYDSTAGHLSYFADMPDGVGTAYQIAHQKQN